LDSDTISILNSRGLQHTPENYTSCLKEAMKRAPSTAHTYNFWMRLPDPNVNQVIKHAESVADTQAKVYEQIAETMIGNVVTGLPRLPSGEVNFDLATDAVNRFIS
jgi:hypothetical protein